MTLWDLRVTVDSIGGRPVCGLAVGDSFDVTQSCRLSLPPRPPLLPVRAGGGAAAAARQAA